MAHGARELAETYRGTVYPWECDMFGHLNVRHYVAKFDEGTWNLFAHLGMPPSYLRQARTGMAAVQQNIAYRRELLPGDIVHVRSGAIEIGERKLRLFHRMYHGESGEEAAYMEITGVHMDLSRRKAVPFPSGIRAHIQGLIEGAAA